MTRKYPVSRAARGSTTHQSASTTRASSPPAMIRPGTVELPEPPDAAVPLAAVAHSMQLDARRKFAATYEDITQYMDKCEYLFDHDEFYDKSYKSLAKTVTELNRIGTDAQLQEREQLYNALIDWLSTSSFSVEAPAHGIINEHQLIESGQTTRDVLFKMLLGLERLRALHITITDKTRSAAQLDVSKPTDRADNKRQLLKMVDDSSFVWKTAAAEIVQLLHDERSKGGELVELYADKIRYLMGELEAQSNMITELRVQLDEQLPIPIKFHDLDLKTKHAKHEAASRQTKQTTVGQQQTTSDDVDQDDLLTATAISTLPDFNKQLITTLQKELEECRRQNASVVARGHEAAAKIRFLTEESNRKDKQIAQLQANIVKMKSETREVNDENVKREDSDDQERRQMTGGGQMTAKRTSKAGARGRRALDSIQLQETDVDDTASPMRLRHVIAAAKRQKRPSQASHSAVDLPLVSSSSQLVSQSPAAATNDVTESRTDTTRTGRAAHTTTDKQARAQRRAKGKLLPTDRHRDRVITTATAATADKQPQASSDLPETSTLQEMGSFWQRSEVKEWTPTDMSADNRVAAKDVKTSTRSRAKQSQTVNDVDMNEAIEMTKLFLTGSKTQLQSQQQPTPVKAKRRESIEQQRKAVATAAHIRPITAKLFTDSTTSKTPTTASRVDEQRRADKSSTRPAVTPSTGLRAPSVTPSLPAAETSKLVDSQQYRAKTPAEAAKLRAARLSAALFHSDEARAQKQSPFSGAAFIQQQQQKPTTNSKPTAKTGYHLVGVNMQNLAQQAKLLETDTLPKTPRRF